MEITKGENANLAGMEPRCPKCDKKDLRIVVFSDFKMRVRCFDCREMLTKSDGDQFFLCDLREFFRSPAPTPPLDVEAEKRIAEIRERESKATKGPWHQGTVKGITDDCVYREDGSNVCKALLVESKAQNLDFIAHSRQDIPFLLEQISLLRRHIASPAPQDFRLPDELMDGAVKVVRPTDLRNRVGMYMMEERGIKMGRNVDPGDVQDMIVEFVQRELTKEPQ